MDYKILSEEEYQGDSGGKEKIKDTVVYLGGINGKINQTVYRSELVSKTGLPLKGDNCKPIELNKLDVKKSQLYLIYKKLKAEGLDIEPTWVLSQEWTYPDETIRVFMFHQDFTRLMDSEYGVNLLTYCHENEIIRDLNGNGIWLYLTSLLPEHKVILEQFDAIIQNKPE